MMRLNQTMWYLNTAEEDIFLGEETNRNLYKT